MISFESRGSFKRTEGFLKTMSNNDIFRSLEGYAQEGVSALASATPVDSGLAASSWDYTVERSRGSYSIYWTNSNTEGGAQVVIMLQYGHGTGTGGYVRGRDFINPAIRPIFDKIANNVWKAVTSA